MKNKFKILVFLITVSPILSMGQDTTRVYFDKNWKEIDTNETYSYSRIIVKQESGIYLVQDYFASGKLQMEGFYEDDSLKTEVGKFVWYYENGVKSQKGTYLKGKRAELWMKWFENGSKSEEGNYLEGKKTGIWKDWFENGELKSAKPYVDGEADGKYVLYHESGSKSEEGSYIAGDKIGIWEEWFENGQLKSKTQFVDGKAEGKFVHYYEDGALFAERYFEKGEFVRSNYFHEDGTPFPEDHVGDKLAQFPGGLEKMYEYLRDNIKYPSSAKRAGIQGKVYAQFVVWTDGSISDVKILKGIGSECDAEVIRIISAMPNWEPAIQLNEIVATKFMLPVYFKLSGGTSKKSDSEKKKGRR